MSPEADNELANLKRPEPDILPAIVRSSLGFVVPMPTLLLASSTDKVPSSTSKSGVCVLLGVNLAIYQSPGLSVKPEPVNVNMSSLEIDVNSAMTT